METSPPTRRAGRGWLLPFVLGLAAALLLLLLGGWPRSLGGRPVPEPRPVTPRGDLAEDEKATIELFQRTSPSVVYITTLASESVGLFEVQEVPRGTGSGLFAAQRRGFGPRDHTEPGDSATSRDVARRPYARWAASP